MNQVVLDNQVISLVATTTDGWSGFLPRTADSTHSQVGFANYWENGMPSLSRLVFRDGAW